MDPSAYIDAELWHKMLKEIGLEQFNMRENRYDQAPYLNIRISRRNFDQNYAAVDISTTDHFFLKFANPLEMN